MDFKKKKREKKIKSWVLKNQHKMMTIMVGNWVTVDEDDHQLTFNGFICISLPRHGVISRFLVGL